MNRSWRPASGIPSYRRSNESETSSATLKRHGPVAQPPSNGVSAAQTAFVPFGNIGALALAAGMTVAGGLLLALHRLTTLQGAFLLVGGIGLGASAAAALISMSRASAR